MSQLIGPGEKAQWMKGLWQKPEDQSLDPHHPHKIYHLKSQPSGSRDKGSLEQDGGLDYPEPATSGFSERLSLKNIKRRAPEEISNVSLTLYLSSTLSATLCLSVSLSLSPLCFIYTHVQMCTHIHENT